MAFDIKKKASKHSGEKVQSYQPAAESPKEFRSSQAKIEDVYFGGLKRYYKINGVLIISHVK